MIDSVNTFSGHSSSMAPVCGVSGGERDGYGLWPLHAWGSSCVVNVHMSTTLMRVHLGIHAHCRVCGGVEWGGIISRSLVFNVSLISGVAGYVFQV